LPSKRTEKQGDGGDLRNLVNHLDRRRGEKKRLNGPKRGVGTEPEETSLGRGCLQCRIRTRGIEGEGSNRKVGRGHALGTTNSGAGREGWRHDEDPRKGGRRDLLFSAAKVSDI